MTMHIIEVARVTPAPDSDQNSANSLTIPLTFFDLPWLLFQPGKRVFFYKITESTREHFHSFILPKLKLSLSFVLRNYLPLSGRITWHPNEPKPSIAVSQNDGFLVTTMILQTTMTLHITEVSRITPAVDSVHNSANSLTIPLTFFDLPWLLFQPVKRIFFYKLTESTREHFHSFILPKLKLSLSLALRNYLPLSGHIIWNPNEPKPSIVVSQNDAVLVTEAETDADFSHLSGYGPRPVSELRSLFPELPVSDDSATAFSLQITLFPNHGFSIGLVLHHAVMDGKSLSMFVKAWAHICKQQLEDKASLPEKLIPSYDRSLIKDSTGLDEKMIEMVRSLKEDKTNIRSLTPFLARALGDEVVLATLVLSREDIERLKNRVKNESQPLHLSTFVIAYAYMWSCFVKARGGSGERLVSFLFVGDFRERLDPPLPATYFGNCLFGVGSYNRKAAEFAEENGFINGVKILSDLVKGLSSRKIETIAKEFAESFDSLAKSTQFGSVAASTRLRVYESDFGWGRPIKTDVVSIDEGEAISMAERRDESGGVEIGVCLKKSELDILLSFFKNGLLY